MRQVHGQSVTWWNTFTVPNAPRTPNRSVRVPEDLWSAAKVIATAAARR
jgi:hypothetical protein